jgi:hypothetical protein
MPEERIVFNDPEEARAWDMYACANIGCGGWDMMFECADMMLLERRKRMAPEKVEADDDLDGDGLATLDAAILSGMMAVGGHPTNDEQRRTYARALIAKLLESAELTDTAMYDDWAKGYQDALTEIRRRAGIEGGES